MNATGQHSAVRKLQRFFRAKQSRKGKGFHYPLDLRQVTFHDDTFMVNGKPVAPQPHWTVKTQGIAIAQVDDVQPYVTQDKCLTLDVNTAVLNQCIPVGKNFQIEQMMIPVMDADKNHALIRVWLLHMGAKKATMKPAMGSDVEVVTDDTCVIVLNVHKPLVETSFWTAITESPARHVMRTYFQPADPQHVLQIWSRRWSKSGKPCKVDEADQFSMLCRINKAEVQGWLKQSGIGVQPIFCSLKADGNHDNSNAHRIIWVGKDIHTARIQLTSAPDHQGLVHRAPHSFGIRFETARFATAWKEIKGDDPLPSQIQCKQKYLLAGAPASLTGPKLEEWSTGVQWPVRVLRSFGGGKFLVGSEDEVPSHHLAIHNHPVICQPYVEKQGRSNQPVIIGKLNLPMPAADPDGEDTVFTNDPWAAGRSRATDMQGNGAWARYQGPSKPKENMQVDEPDGAMDIMSKQSTRITEVESQLKTIQEQMSADQRANQARFAQVDHNLQAMQTGLRATLEDALRQQSANLVSTFETLLKKSPRTDGGKDSHRSRSREKRDP